MVEKISGGFSGISGLATDINEDDGISSNISPRKHKQEESWTFSTSESEAEPQSEDPSAFDREKILAEESGRNQGSGRKPVAKPRKVESIDRPKNYPGSLSNVIAALASLFIPGLGQLFQGRIIVALVFFISSALLWIIFLGWIVHLWAVFDAANFRL